MALPPKPTRAQKDAAKALALDADEQARRWKAHSGDSQRLIATHARLDQIVRQRFPHAQDVFEYNMRGWAIRRPVDIKEWKGTIDPNWIRIYVAERKQGITIHVWNPYDFGLTGRPELTEAGFKPMVGCLQYNRKGEVPVEALAGLLDEMQAALAAERDSHGSRQL